MFQFYWVRLGLVRFTVNLKFFMRILFSPIALKDILAALEIRD